MGGWGGGVVELGTVLLRRSSSHPAPGGGGGGGERGELSLSSTCAIILKGDVSVPVSGQSLISVLISPVKKIKDRFLICNMQSK